MAIFAAVISNSTYPFPAAYGASVSAPAAEGAAFVFGFPKRKAVLFFPVYKDFEI